MLIILNFHYCLLLFIFCISAPPSGESHFHICWGTAITQGIISTRFHPRPLYASFTWHTHVLNIHRGGVPCINNICRTECICTGKFSVDDSYDGSDMETNFETKQNLTNKVEDNSCNSPFMEINEMIKSQMWILNVIYRRICESPPNTTFFSKTVLDFFLIW